MEVQTITTNTEGQLIVVTERAGSNNICPVVCHGSCDGCSGNGADECSGCPDSLRAADDGTCFSVCENGEYRANGTVVFTMAASFNGVIADQFDSAEGSTLESVVEGIGSGLGAKVSFVSAERISASEQVGAILTATLEAPHASFEELRDGITASIEEGYLLALLKQESQAYFYTTAAAFATNLSADLSDTCLGCDNSCNGCTGPSSSECISCDDDHWILEGECFADCPSGYFADPYDYKCKPVDCEFGDVVLTADSGAIVVSENSWKYVAEGQIAEVTPSSGQVTTPVVISGMALRGAGDNVINVTFAGVLATITEESDTEVSVVAAASVAGTGDVVILSNAGATVTLEDGWQHLKAGSITSVSPGAGQLGTLITVSGSNMKLGGSSIELKIGDRVATVLSYSDTEIIARVPDASGRRRRDTNTETVPFTITNEFGAVFTSSGVTFDLLERGEIDSVTPATGQLGTEIVISGERLLGGGQSVYKVSLGDVNATVVEYSNSTISIVDVGGGAVGVDVDVVIVSNTGAVVTKAGGYQALASASILGLAPQVGHAGTNVTILGSSLLGGGEEIVASLLPAFRLRRLLTTKATMPFK